MPTTYPRLFKKNSNGSLQEWQISVEGNVITSVYGQVGGAMQTAIDVVKSGKNAGRKNATTAEEQAVLEAKSKWEKQKKKGYVEQVEAAHNGEVDVIIEGGIEPMLAHKFRDHGNKMPFPAMAQPKFDGIRCVAVIQGGTCTLWSRTRKRITGVPHVAIHLSRMFPTGTVILDGELYNHSFKKDFEKIVSYVRQQTAKPGHEVVEYHVYDVIDYGKGNQERANWLDANIPDHGTIKRVETVTVASEEEMMDYFASCRERGYEGCMVRNMVGTYQNKRSYNLLKVKEMDDAEFEIIGVEEGRGKMAGKAIFVCKTDAGNTFTVKKEGKLDDLAAFLNDTSVIGKKLTVRYQGFTNGNVPRFPVGVTVRDYE